MLNTLIKYASAASAVLAFVGFHYLEIYHGYFGGANIADDFSTAKQVSRSIQFVLSSWKICVFIAFFGIIFWLSQTHFHFRIHNRTFSKYWLFAPLFIVSLLALFALVRVEAKRLVILELSPRTTSLRELRCISSRISLTNNWYDQVYDQGRKVLIARRADDFLFVFFPPENLELGTPYVTIMRIGISNEDIIAESRATTQRSGLSDRQSCGR